MSENGSVEDILGLLGLGAGKSDLSIVSQPSPRGPFADTGLGDLVRVEFRGESAWLAIGHAERPLRVTRTKLELVLRYHDSIRAFAGGAQIVEGPLRDVSIRVGRFLGEPHLFITKENWRPIRISRENAGLIVEFADGLKTLLKAKW